MTRIMTRFYIQDQGVKFYGTVLSIVTEKEIYDLYSPYRYYFVEFDTGNDKIYPRVMNIKIPNMNHMNTYRYIACETEMIPFIEVK